MAAMSEMLTASAFSASSASGDVREPEMDVLDQQVGADQLEVPAAAHHRGVVADAQAAAEREFPFQEGDEALLVHLKYLSDQGGVDRVLEIVDEDEIHRLDMARPSVRSGPSCFFRAG